MTVRAYIGIGSNLDNPVAQVKEALEELGYLPDTILAAKSGLYSCSPMGPADQPDYVNAVAALDTLLSAEDLYRELVRIEDQQGRSREGEKWGPRRIDLDLLMYGKGKIRKKDLVVPHPGMHERDFVIIPLIEIAGNISVPGLGKLSGLLGQCENHSVRKLVTG